MASLDTVKLGPAPGGANNRTGARTSAGVDAGTGGRAHDEERAAQADERGAPDVGAVGQRGARAGDQSATQPASDSADASASGRAAQFARLLSAQKPVQATTTAAPQSAAANAAKTAAEPVTAARAVDISTLLGELTGTKPAGTATAAGAATTPAAKKSEARKDDAADFEGSQSTVLDMQALLRLLEAPVTPQGRAPADDAAVQATIAGVCGQGKSATPDVTIGAATTQTVAGVADGAAATAPGAASGTATPVTAGDATSAATALALAATDSAVAGAASPTPTPAPTAATATPSAAVQPQTVTQISADANGATLTIAQTLTQPTGAGGATAAPSVERSIGLPVGHRDWSGAIANHVVWQVKSDVQSARVSLTPEGMGPVDVHIDVDGKQVSVNFTAAHVETRQALEQSMPQLRAMLAGSGLTLGQTSVQQQTQQQAQAAATQAAQRDLDHSSEDTVVSQVSVRRGLVDEYA